MSPLFWLDTTRYLYQKQKGPLARAKFLAPAPGLGGEQGQGEGTPPLGYAVTLCYAAVLLLRRRASDNLGNESGHAARRRHVS